MQAIKVYKNTGGAYVDVTKRLGLGDFSWERNSGSTKSFLGARREL